MNFEQVIISGKLAKDPELKYTDKGLAICNVSVPVSYPKGSKENREWKTKWYNATLFGASAEYIAEHAKKGTNVVVSGKIEVGDDGNPPAWIGKDDKPHSKINLVPAEVTISDSVAKSEKTEKASTPDFDNYDFNTDDWG